MTKKRIEDIKKFEISYRVKTNISKGRMIIAQRLHKPKSKNKLKDFDIIMTINPK